jgi:choline/glycine/proline betaine transport protein
MLHFNNPIIEGASDVEKARLAIRNTYFHYGFHVWGIYMLLGIALAYFTFNKNAALSLKSTLVPLFGTRLNGWPGHIIDIVAVLATLFGLATSLGFGALQFSTGLSEYFGLENSTSLQVTSIIGITLIATISVVTGLNKGLKYLSNANIIIALVVFAFVLILGSSLRLIDGFVESLGTYLSGLVELSLFRNQYGTPGDWFKGWSMFY